MARIQIKTRYLWSRGKGESPSGSSSFLPEDTVLVNALSDLDPGYKSDTKVTTPEVKVL